MLEMSWVTAILHLYSQVTYRFGNVFCNLHCLIVLIKLDDNSWYWVRCSFFLNQTGRLTMKQCVFYKLSQKMISLARLSSRAELNIAN